VRVWRLCRTRHSAAALSGDGGLRAPGRWHRRGTRIVYTSATLSLATLEVLVWTNPVQAPSELMAVEVEIPDSVETERTPLRTLPAGWDGYPARAFTQQHGSQWVAGGRTVVLEVPSAVIPRECNYLLNPAHPEFSRIRIVGRTPFSFDARLLS